MTWVLLVGTLVLLYVIINAMLSLFGVGCTSVFVVALGIFLVVKLFGPDVANSLSFNRRNDLE